MTRPPPITAAQLLDLQTVEPDLFRSHHTQANPAGALFGGQVLAQGLVAATRTVPGWPAHSLHGYFLRAGDAKLPVDYQVERLRDGRRFAARTVRASQDGRVIFHLHCSFHDPEPGNSHHQPMPDDLPGPEALLPLDAFVASHADRLPDATVANYTAPFPLELRLVAPETYFFAAGQAPRRAFWVRLPSAAGTADRDQNALLAFLSDYWLAGIAVGPGRLSTNSQQLSINSLDHAIWFHRPARADEWLLYFCDTPSGGDGRGLARGLLYDRSGRLVATTSQEALFRDGG